MVGGKKERKKKGRKKGRKKRRKKEWRCVVRWIRGTYVVGSGGGSVAISIGNVLHRSEYCVLRLIKEACSQTE